MTTRTTTFEQGSHRVRAVDLKTGVRRRSSTERAIGCSSGLRTEDFSTHCSSLIIGVLFTCRYQTTNGIFTRRAKQITQNIGRHCNFEDQSGNVGRDGGHNSMVQHSPSKGRFYEGNEYLLRSVDSGDGGQRNGCCSRDPPSRSQLRT
jgi:hypothetical protein